MLASPSEGLILLQTGYNLIIMRDHEVDCIFALNLTIERGRFGS